MMTTDGGATWQVPQDGLPGTAVTDLLAEANPPWEETDQISPSVIPLGEKINRPDGQRHHRQREASRALLISHDTRLQPDFSYIFA